ncbi:MAG: hypothetical protein RBG1_1C00001G1758 [candidate division Zixibacteria bacterium RBG-1]|nr:MAG: hypothetical protein RBG1_1C00001G1758 [candidate division Zixibacteria bacterium RBG-1]OGC85360.1 MAG: hypothetical protein A2V73_09095 [candidate division Zixibacteria bacterium RBG_19FT_COMBO_42_43]
MFENKDVVDEPKTKWWQKLSNLLSATLFVGLVGLAYVIGKDISHEKVNNLEQRNKDQQKIIERDSTLASYYKSQATQLEDSLKVLLKPNLILKDTILYEGDAIYLFNGAVSIKCSGIDSVFENRASFEARIDLSSPYESFKIDSKYLTVSSGEQREFFFQGKRYILVILSCRKFGELPGVKIAVYLADPKYSKKR